MVNSRFFYIILSLLAGVISVSGTANAQHMDTPEVDIAIPITKEITEYYEYTGRFRATQEVELRARVSGYLKEISFKDGQDVKKGDTLFIIDKRPYIAAVKQAEANLKHAQSALALAKLEVQRGESLLSRGNISTDEVDKRRADVIGADATVESAEASLQLALLDLEFTEVKAPFDGRLSDRQVDVGTLVSGGSEQSTILTTIVSTGPIYFYFDAPEADYLHFIRMDRAGERKSARYEVKPVQVQLSDEDGWPHEGVLDFLDSKIDTNAGTIRARAYLENTENLLLPGYFGRLQLPAFGPHSVFMLPDRAIVSDQGRKTVYVVLADGSVKVTEVELGPVIDGLRVIRTGINANDNIIVNGLLRVRPGVKVKPNTVIISAE
ncbi:efflux RND transporter periplasmic adaptor subunit [Kordiimonas pumila]|uniref:Efflux RND transporter periplasmic adaptor subunit n=1 Tax=Kordiimonas pumila TaxID=2161677 RepID=A0ABV7D1Z7_9PROT|nr:efflux RND transporter periplasmic adaptor subunit [Kordiimonas pumila]